ncbi:MAG TPA: PKD domain-containing protein [Chitinophaga sp.]|uniref:gliding motility-associated C-terminal domain-containing protein n=1 Tax=Chitinophaga sp. TaxID=1869181 RepID=UPI002C14229D|nr:PKD domain-containing protein [Chitinophaga sp.]HVI46577.1 PKD domain-containing protein [Chitinophaga sp.]
MKKILSILICLACAIPAFASHIIGGQVYYKFIGQTGNMYTYRVSLKLYRICGKGERIAEMPTTVYLAAFDKGNNQLTGTYTVNRSAFEEKRLTQFDPCIVNPPEVCFQVGLFETDITVPLNNAGYVVAFQSCCRETFLANVVSERIPGGGPNDLGTGATYFTELPGSNNNALGNSSPVFNKEEATLICADRKFVYDFSASDPNGDQLTYEFCSAYKGGSTTDQSGIPPAAVNPPYNNVTYISPFSGASPLGPNVKIDPVTGIISGTAPAPGKYVVTVCVNEYRNGVKIGTLHKDFHVNVTTCVKQVTASMPEKYADCSSMSVTFLNNSTLGKPYFWDFGDGTTQSVTTTDPLTHTYTRPGKYTVKLYVDKDSNCGDSAIATAYVFPVFKPDFVPLGLCTQKATTFTDRTRSDAGAVEYYKWDFGTGDTSNLKNPVYQYKAPGTYTVKLYARAASGCEQTISQDVTIYDNPPLNAISDTLLCAKDSLHMWANSSVGGTFKWTPDDYNILNPATADPFVFPLRDTTYKVTFTDNQGCVNSKNVFVDVKDTLLLRTVPDKDSTVCTGDEIRLRSVADGPYAFQWKELGSNNIVSNGAEALVTPAPPRQSYRVEASLGKCRTADTVSLKVVDPPKATAAPDTTVCYGIPVTLRATGGAFYRWTPPFYVEQPSQPISLAHPKDTTVFTVTVTDTLGCPKPVTATAKVNVVPPVPAFAGNDTIVMLNRPFQLHATGGIRYTWAPATGLNSPNIDNPVTTINKDITYTVTAYTIEGCSGQDDIFIRFFNGPEIYIPNAFSPNGDGQNDVFRPVPVGIVQLEFFRVFDRWGKLLYSNTAYMKGWDGRVNGEPAPVGTYVWVVQGKDINNQTVLRKGTVTLVR